jgi:16S rRNA (cytosine967-C5)-methyltransferase
MANAGARTRAVAAEIVDAVVTGGQSLDAAIARNESRVAPNDRSLLRMLCFGTLRNHWRLQSWISELISRPLKRRDSVINALLAIGLFQLVDTRIPDHAAEDLSAKASDDEEVKWNHPRWLIETVRHDWPDSSHTIFEANNARGPMWLRCNTSRQSAAQYGDRLAAAGLACTFLEGVPDAVRLDEPVTVEELPGFTDGDVSVQDAAAQIAARWVMVDKPARVLDACAAPGGKSGHLLELGADELELTAIDSDADRIERVRENHDRLGVNATITLADASKPEEWWDGRPFDAILLDAPCSATGVIRRHPDIKLLRRASDIVTLSALQGEILSALWRLLAPGGRLLYVTCSVLAAENNDVVQGFLEANDDATEDIVLPNNNIRDLMHRKACGYQILPGTANMDGFYYACLVKKVS